MTSYDPFIGDTLGSYEILEAIGEGGMARIYKGFHTELNRYAAIKVVHWGLQEDPEFTERFRREAQAIASLRHSNIVQIFDFGKHESGYFMAMEFIDGSDLAIELRQAKAKQELLPKDKIIRVIKDVAAALDYAHNHDVVHRDVKPSNVMINSEGQSILADFGLVMLPTQASQATLGNTFGTPHYVAPEQAISSAAAVPASDIYSLGIILYEMTTGELPFDDEAPLSVALKHVSEIPTPPTAINPNLPQDVEDIILKALAKDPVDRFVTTGDMALALEAALSEGRAFEQRNKKRVATAPQMPAGVPPAAEVSSMTLPRAAAVAPIITSNQSPVKGRQATPSTQSFSLSGWPLMALIGILGVLIGAVGLFFISGSGILPTPTPSPTVVVIAQEPSKTPTPTLTNTPTHTPEPPTNTPAPTLTPTPVPSPTSTPTNTPIPPAPTLTSTPTPSPTPTNTATPLPRPTPTPAGLSGKVLFKTDRAGFVQIYQMNSDGSNQRPLDDLSIYTALEAALPFSPDKQDQILVRGEGQLDLWRVNLGGAQELRVTSTKKAEYDPAWSPVDNRIVYVSEETGNGDIYMLNLDGSAVVRLTDNVEDFDKHPTWSPDGKRIAFWSDMGFNNNRQIWAIDLETGVLTSLSDNPFNDWDPVWVP